MKEAMSRRQFCAAAIKTAAVIPFLAGMESLFAQAGVGRFVRVSPVASIDLTSDEYSALTVVGGAVKIVVAGESKPVLVVRYDETSYRAFSTKCPHQGCEVNMPENDTVICPCHISTFGMDGSFISGPALQDLKPFYPIESDSTLSIYSEPVSLKAAPSGNKERRILDVQGSKITIDSPYENGQITLYTLSGRKVYSEKLDGKGRGEVSMSSSVGIYLLQIRSGGFLKESFLVNLK